MKLNGEIPVGSDCQVILDSKCELFLIFRGSLAFYDDWLDLFSVQGGGGADFSGGGGGCQGGVFRRRPAAQPPHIAAIMSQYYSVTSKKWAEIGKI